MKALVYTTAFGEEQFYSLAEEMFRSLRKRGYLGDVVLLCDREPRFSREFDVKAIVLNPIGNFPLLKARLGGVFDVSAYDRILFVDSDVVFLRDPSPLFELAGERMCVSRDHCPLRRNSFNISFFSAEERKNPALPEIRSINTGVVVFPGSRFLEYCARWLEAWESPEARKRLASSPMKSAELRDQPLMQHLVTNRSLDTGYIPDSLLMMPLYFTEAQALHPETVVVHLNGSSRTPAQKQRLLEIMRELNTLDSTAAFEAVCARLQAGRRQSSFPSLPG